MELNHEVDDFRTLKVFCDWVAHTVVDRLPAETIVEQFDTLREIFGRGSVRGSKPPHPPSNINMVTMTSIVSDIRYALRALRREWITSVVAIVSIALGIGANIAIFSLVDALLLGPLSGVRAPDRLARIDVALPSTSGSSRSKVPCWFSPARWRGLRWSMHPSALRG